MSKGSEVENILYFFESIDKVIRKFVKIQPFVFPVLEICKGMIYIKSINEEDYFFHFLREIPEAVTSGANGTQCPKG